jgi:hypothetical protein
MSDHRVVLGGRGEGLGRHLLAERQRGRPVVRRQFFVECVVIGRIGDDRHVGVVLGRRAHHARAADVDVLDDLVARRPAHHRFLERVEVDHDEVDRADLVRFHRRRVFRVVAHCEQAAMDQRVERLDPPVHHLGKAGHVGYVLHVEPRIAHRARGSARGNQLDSGLGQLRAEVRQTALVGHREQCPPDRHVGHVLAT